MNRQNEAIIEIHEFLTALNIPYAIIGGIAVQYWGEPRLTADIDITILTSIENEEEVCNKVIKNFSPRNQNVLEFAKKNRVLLLYASNGCPIDISLGVPIYEDEMMKRRISYAIDPQRSVFICSAEDLIIHKAVAGRPRDIEDLKGIIIVQKNKMDIEYVRLWLTEFSQLLENYQILQIFEDNI